ncbi:MAG: threonylcarbamoyl-AMP synthase [Gemmatimonadales bacterium]|nr:MAG: threonylcarbamoyl-AMP synthase [Gemmatimonadales bacterium]
MSEVGVTDVRDFDTSGDLSQAVSALRSGGVVVHPTETVYGFGGSLEPRAVAAVQHLKRRDASRPLLVLVSSQKTVDDLVWTDAARELARAFWPGGVTLVLGDPDRAFPDGVRSPAGGVAVRRPSHPVAAGLVEAFGAPMTSTSANAPGRAPATSGQEALEVALAMRPLGSVHLLDAGTLPSSPPSTIVDCTGEAPRVLREGSTPISRIRSVVPDVTHG